MGLFGPTNAQRAAFGKPGEGALNNPTPSRELGFARDWTGFNKGFVATAAMFNMGNVAFLFDKLMHIWEIIASIKAQVLFKFISVRSRHDNGNHKLVNQPLVMPIGCCNVHGQGCATSVHQDMNLAAPFGSVYRAFTRILSTQRGWTGLTINGLPFPLNVSSSSVKAHKLSHQSLKDPILLPFLKTLMQGGTAHAKPVFMYRFPLTTRPQHVPYPVYHSSVIGSFASWPFLLNLSRQEPSQASPQRSWHSKIIHLLWFLGMILAQDVSVLLVVWRLQSERDTSSFSTFSSIYG